MVYSRWGDEPLYKGFVRRFFLDTDGTGTDQPKKSVGIQIMKERLKLNGDFDDPSWWNVHERSTAFQRRRTENHQRIKIIRTTISFLSGLVAKGGGEVKNTYMKISPTLDSKKGTGGNKRKTHFVGS